VSVNLSGRQFYRDDLAQRIVDIVRAAGCAPDWIELEVTESSLLHDLDKIKKVLQQLRDWGFSVAIDDFGTGYSSLSHLKHFPIDTLKIDISFIADLETDSGDAAITEAIIALARGLGLRVVAEGVGTEAQLAFLEDRGCDYFQGYWVSPALPATEFIEMALSRPGKVTVGSDAAEEAPACAASVVRLDDTPQMNDHDGELQEVLPKRRAAS
jgi:EAL domain-containing protein (putative c-di-GMP-specific phosphodiesterase class I)